LRQMDQGTMDGDGRGNTHGGLVCGIIGTTLGVLSLGCGIFLLISNAWMY
jgi:hypothetical protein